MSTLNNSAADADYKVNDAHGAIIHDAGKRRSILVAVCIALMAIIAAVTGLNVAQPHLALDLNATQGEVLWMINIYAITLAALLLPLGAAGDRWGHKPVLLLGLVIFGMANMASGSAPTTEIMMLARLLSGVDAAMVMPVIFPRRSGSIGKQGYCLCVRDRRQRHNQLTSTFPRGIGILRSRMAASHVGRASCDGTSVGFCSGSRT